MCEVSTQGAHSLGHLCRGLARPEASHSPHYGACLFCHTAVRVGAAIFIASVVTFWQNLHQALSALKGHTATPPALRALELRRRRTAMARGVA